MSENDLAPDPVEETWIIAFVPKPPGMRRTWFDWFTRHRPGFQHVMCLRFDARLKIWFALDWRQDGLTLEPLTRWEATNVIGWIMQDGLAYQVKKQRRVRRFPAPLMYCVNFVKHITGLKCIAVTPYQLHRHLKRIGAQHAFEE